MKSAAETYTQPKSIILVGQPGSGKTTLALQFPDLFVLDLDNNLAGPISYLKSAGKFKDFKYDSPYTDDEGKQIDRKDWFGRVQTIMTEVINDPSIKTILVDSTTALVDIALIETLKHQGRKLGTSVPKNKLAKFADEQMQIQDWGVFFNIMKQTIFNLKASGKTLIFASHIRTKEDELTNILQQFIAIPGQMGDIIAGYFAEVWCMTRSFDRIKKKEVRTVRTFPSGATDENLGLKSSSGIVSGAPVEADELIKKVLA